MPTVEPASSFMVGASPGGVSYAAPLVTFQQLAQLPEDYYRGTQEKRTLALQNAFPNGLPTVKDANGNDILDRNGQRQIDVSSVVGTLTKLGGAEAAQSLVPTLIQQQIGKNAADMLAPGRSSVSAGNSGMAAGSSGPHAGPANVGGPVPQPRLSSVGTDNQSADTIRSLATGIFNGRDATGLIDYYSQRNQISPDAPLGPQQAQAFMTWAGQVKQRQRGTQNENEDPSASGAPTGDVTPQDQAINGRNAAPSVASGTSGAPAPAAGSTGSETLRGVAADIFGRDVPGLVDSYSRQSGIGPDAPLSPQQEQTFTSWAGRFKLSAAMNRPQQGAIVPPVAPPRGAVLRDNDPSSSGAPSSGTSVQGRAINGAGAAPPATGGASGAPAPPPSPGGTGISPDATAAARAIVPREFWGREREYAQQKLDEAQRYESVGSLYAATNPALAKGFQDTAAQKRNEANMVLEALRSGAQLTDQQRNMLDPRVQQQELQANLLKERQAAAEKQYLGLSAKAGSYLQEQKTWLDMARSILSQPETYTGAGSNISQFVNRVRAVFGDQKAAEYQSLLQKVTAASVLNTMNNQRFDLDAAGEKAGRMFQAQVEQVQKTVPTLEGTLAGNRALVEIQDRMGKLSNDIAREASRYRQQHGYLDAGWDDHLANWLSQPQHQPFSEMERSHPDVLGAPSAPPDTASKEQLKAWGAGMGLKPGDPYRTADGRLKAFNP